MSTTSQSSASDGVQGSLARLAMHVDCHPARASANTRSRILEEAIILFAGRGYGGTSMRDIAREVGLKAASIYVHFPGGKQQLLHDALVGIFDEFLAFILDGLDRNSPSAEQLRKVLSRHVTWQLRFAPTAVSWDTAAEQFTAEPTVESGLAQEVTERQELYHGYVRALVEDLHAGPSAAERSRAALVLCDRARVWHVSGGGRLSTEEGVAALVWELAKDLVSGPHGWQWPESRAEATAIRGTAE